jgi:hypothetical protein
LGTVTKGYEVVKKIEEVGSQAGPTSQPVTIADSGEVGSEKAPEPEMEVIDPEVVPPS